MLAFGCVTDSTKLRLKEFIATITISGVKVKNYEVTEPLLLIDFPEDKNGWVAFF